MEKRGKWNLHIIEVARSENCNSLDGALSLMKQYLALSGPVSRGLKITEAPFKQLGYNNTMLLLQDDRIVGSIYEYQDETDTRPCSRSENEKGDYILYRSFNIFTGKLEADRHKFYSFDELYNYLYRNNGFLKQNIAIGELDKEFCIDGWFCGTTCGVYHIADDDSISILGYFALFGDLAALGVYTDIPDYTKKESSKQPSSRTSSALQEDTVTSVMITVCVAKGIISADDETIFANTIGEGIEKLYAVLDKYNIAANQTIDIMDEPFECIGYSNVKMLMVGDMPVGALWISRATPEPQPLIELKKREPKPSVASTTSSAPESEKHRLRKCLVLIPQTGARLKAYFHGWVKSNNKSNNCDTLALVEYINSPYNAGVCDIVDLHSIQFIDV